VTHRVWNGAKHIARGEKIGDHLGFLSRVWAQKGAKKALRLKGARATDEGLQSHDPRQLLIEFLEGLHVLSGLQSFSAGAVGKAVAT
jgi:hypothetical protein